MRSLSDTEGSLTNPLAQQALTGLSGLDQMRDLSLGPSDHSNKTNVQNVSVQDEAYSQSSDAKSDSNNMGISAQFGSQRI